VEVPGATYFITYRLAGSLPPKVVERLRERYLARMRAAVVLADPHERQRVELAARNDLHDEMDHFLDEGHGAKYLADPRVAEMLVENLRTHERRKYQLRHWVVMPNHVHLLLTPLPLPSGKAYWTLASILHSLRSYTSLRANRLVNRRGAFWQREYYDRLIRDEEDFVAKAAYIENNPVKAGLCAKPSDWPWSSAHERLY
jgi:REP element-mobilizing transposase RayT